MRIGRIVQVSTYPLMLVLAAACGGAGSGSSSSSQGSSSSQSVSSSQSASSSASASSSSSSSTASSGTAAAAAINVDPHILVDQFGYRPGDPKVAVIRNPQAGYDASDTFTPGSTYQVLRASDGGVVFSGQPTPWNSGAVEASSGDNGWWFDFSTLTTPGTYFVYDTSGKVRSPTFTIAQNVYENVLKAAMRMYFYQREGTAAGGGAKQPPYAAACWTDTPSYVGPNQDTQAHNAMDQTNASEVEELSGGWADAGDTNKYVTFAESAVHQLLSAYQENPSVFTDDFNIPESGNGIPDVLDEVKYETDWIKKMQFYPDGGVALKLGVMGAPAASPPSSDTSPRFYVPECTSATIAAAGMFAHASYVYATIPALQSEAADLQTRAVEAWTAYQNAGTQQTDCDTGIVAAGNADWTAQQQQQEAVVAAVWLFAITGDSTYDTYVQNNYTITRPFNDIGWTRYLAEQGKALLFYTTLPNANAALKATILAAKLSDTENNPQIYGLGPDNPSTNPGDELYRNYLNDAQYGWGSNQVRADYGNTNADVAGYNIAVPSTTTYTDRALETLHYIHGVNPFGMVYLSNMSSYGATSSANEIFHSWFWPGTKWEDAKTSACGPAPGYMPGGPDASAVSDGVPASIAPPANQPEQKSYKDWNGVVGDPQDSWVVSEPAIYYQAAYVELLSRFAD